MPTTDEVKPGGDSAKYLGNHVITFEAGHKIEIDNSPGDRRIHIYHASGTFIEIKDDGMRITKIEGKDQEYVNGQKDLSIKGGDFNISVDGNVLLHATGDLKHEVKGNYEIITHGDFRVKSAGNHFVEAGADQRVQINGKTSHRTSSDREEITGGAKTDTINRDLNQTVGGEHTQIISKDGSVLVGGEYQLVATTGMGLGSGGQLGIASADIMKLKSETQIQTRAVTGTFIRDSYYVEVRSSGAGGSLLVADGYKAAVFSKDNDVRISAGGKFLTETDGGSQLDTAGLIAPIGKYYNG
jgi:hypothetical protein